MVSPAPPSNSTLSGTTTAARPWAFSSVTQEAAPQDQFVVCACTSAGRLPTERGLSLFVSGLLELGDKLGPANRGCVDSQLVRAGAQNGAALLEIANAAAGSNARLDKTFNDKVVIAGFVEQHVHPVLAALTMNTKVISIEDWDAIDGFSPAVRDEKGYTERLKKALVAHKDKKVPFVTWGYHHYFHGEMSRDKLDKLAPDFPVIVWHRSAHELFLNDAALKLTGIDEALPLSAVEGVAISSIRGLTAEVMAENKAMQAVINKSNCKIKSKFAGNIYHYEMDFE